MLYFINKDSNFTVMKYVLYATLAFALLSAYSCGTTKNVYEDTFYNKHNELSLKVKKKILGGKYITFANFTTGSQGKGVDKRVIHFDDQTNPFHFSLNDNSGNITNVQVVTTQKKDLASYNLPDIFNNADDGAQIFYAWFSGGPSNSLQNWELILKNPTYEGLKHDDQTGILRTVNQVIAVHANNYFGSPDSYDKICYEFRMQGVPVAAVEVNGKNKVWMNVQLDAATKFAIAAAISSLLMR